MRIQNIYNLALEMGFCPECLIEELEKMEILEIGIKELHSLALSTTDGEIPFSYNQSWVYLCPDHAKDEDLETNHNFEISVFDDSF